ncbi:glycosyl hydrolase family 81-domain-containing protein [Gongronella butleri]|nr:glycosyl hydrolase family 81-domain-containing protein [Gongronella butleri]
MIPSVFPTIEHPFPSQYYNGTRTRPVPTNAWLSNLFYASTNHQAPTITDPYILRFMDALGDGPPGLSIAHAQKKVYGGYPPMNNVPATDVGYMINPVVADIRFSAKEWENALPASSSSSPAPMARQQQQQKEQQRVILRQQVLDWDFLCATVRLTTANGTTTATNELHVDFPLCKGMPYVTASYRSLTPVFYTQHAFISKPPPLGSPARHFTISLNDDTHYRIYAVDKPIAWTLVSPNLLQADRAYTGTLRIAKVPNPKFESLLDDHAANWPVRSSIKYSPSSYTFDWETEGDQDETLLMYAHAHHMTSMINASTTSLRLSSASKGMMHGVVGTSWTMHEPTSAINQLTWFPTRARPDKAARFDILAALAQDIDEADYDHETNKGDNYFSGKGLQKYALLALLLNRPDDTDIRNPELALTSLEKLKSAFSLFLDNRQQDRFAYDSLYRGVVAVSGLPESMGGTGNPNAAFGHAYYNDHHYHQGYFVVTAAIIHLLDPEWRADDLKLWTDALVRDVNAKDGDPLYAPFRHWDWFAGHTWAGGIKQNGALDGRDQESVPESINFYWGAKLWGMVTGDHAMEELATLQLNIMRRTTYDYFWLLDRNPNYPVGMRRNKVMGIYFEHRTDYVRRQRAAKIT